MTESVPESPYVPHGWQSKPQSGLGLIKAEWVHPSGVSVVQWSDGEIDIYGKDEMIPKWARRTGYPSVQAAVTACEAHVYDE